MACREKIRVIFPRSLARKFSRSAKSVAHERIAVLLGVSGPRGYEISELFYPADGDTTSGKDFVWPTVGLYEKAARHGKARGLVVLGDIHSHPPGYNDAPSCTDWDGHTDFPLMGICALKRDKAGNLRSRIKFYPRLPIVDVRVA